MLAITWVMLYIEFRVVQEYGESEMLEQSNW